MTNRARMYLRYRDLDIPTSCERASCNIGSGTGHFAGNRDVLPISIVGCDRVEKGVHHKKHKSHKTDFVISSLGNPKLIPMATG